jgi:hypothetical protein
MHPTSLQDQIFEIVLQRFARRADAVEALCQLLNLSKDAIYRRLRGDTFLSPQELATLAQRFNLSLDALMTGQTDNVLCHFNAFSRRLQDFGDYLENYVQDLEQMRRLPNLHLYYASVEIPVFTYNFFPELISFKLYIWGRTTWNFPYLRDRSFDFSLVTPPVMRLSQALLQHYLAIDSTELWSLHVTDNTLAQIEYHVYSGGFTDPDEALVLCDKLTDWANHMRLMAAAGRKFPLGGRPESAAGELNLYHNEMVYTNITALVKSDAVRMVYSAYCNPNFLHSSDPKLCDFTEDWFNNIIAKSNPITRAAEKNRDGFFRELLKRIDRVKNRIRQHIEDGRG